MIIALASPRIASALDEGLDKIKRFLSEASAQGAVALSLAVFFNMLGDALRDLLDPRLKGSWATKSD